MEEYQYDICVEFDCCEEYCLECCGKKCHGFDNPDCMFYHAHRILNLNEKE
jgi:hypothetical protein